MKAHTSKLVCAPIFFGMLPVLLWSQSTEESVAGTKILALEHAWNRSEASKEIKVLDALFDNALVYVDPDGTLLTKAQFLLHVRSATVTQVVTQSMQVHMFGTTAIVTGIYQVAETRHGKSTTLRGRFVDTWVYKDSVWVCVSAQSTPIQR